MTIRLSGLYNKTMIVTNLALAMIINRNFVIIRYDTNWSVPYNSDLQSNYDSKTFKMQAITSSAS